MFSISSRLNFVIPLLVATHTVSFLTNTSFTSLLIKPFLFEKLTIFSSLTEQSMMLNPSLDNTNKFSLKNFNLCSSLLINPFAFVKAYGFLFSL